MIEIGEQQYDYPRIVTDDHQERARRQQELAEFYSRVAPVYADKGPPFFGHAGRRLVELAGVEPSDAVLDIATGRGAVLIPAGRHVGRSGHAVGIDIARGMVEHTRHSIALDGLTQATVEQMDAAQLRFAPESFTHVLSSFAVFFFPNLTKVLSECSRVLRPNGVVGFAFSRGVDPRWTWYEELLRACGAFNELPPPTGEPSVRHPGVLVAALKRAHFVEVDEIEEAAELFYATPEDWWASLWTHGSRRPLDRLQPAALARIQTQCLEQARALVGSRGVPELTSFVYVLGRKPADP